MIGDMSNAPRFKEATLGAQNTFTKPMCILAGFNVSMAGTWAGTLKLQRSFNYKQFLQKQIPESAVVWFTVKSYTENAQEVGTFTEPEADVFYRIGFETGGYTSGTALVRLSY